MAGQTDREAQRRRALVTFAQAVDALEEQAGFLEASANRLAARYVADAHTALVAVRLSVHELEASAADASLRSGARRRLRAIAASVAEAGLSDVDRVAQNARLMTSAPQRPALGPALRSQTARVVAWTAEKWSGSPVAEGELRSARAATEALRARDTIVARGQLPPREVQRRRRIVARTAAGVGGGGVLALAAYGAWDLLTMLF